MSKSRVDEPYWTKHKEAWSRSGLSQRSYCKQEGMCNKKFNYHIKRLNEGNRKQDFKFIEAPLGILGKKTERAERDNLKVELPNGVIIFLELSTDRTLAQVLEVVGAI